jgi:predicted MFS family arabinose efflux permease
LAQLLGLAGAGIAVAALDGSRALLVAALGHLVASAWVHFGMDDLPAPPRTGATSESTVRRSWTGNLALVRNRPVRVLMLAMWLPPAFLTGADALLVPYSAERGFPAGTAGWLLAGVPAGMLIGNVVVGRLVSPAARDRLVPALVALMGVPCLVFPAALPWPVIGAAMIVAGFGFTFSLAVQRRFRDAIPPDRRGQAFSLLSTGLMTAQGLCPALAGLVAESVPTADVVAGLGVLTLLTALVLHFTLPGTDRESGSVDTHNILARKRSTV